MSSKFYCARGADEESHRLGIYIHGYLEGDLQTFGCYSSAVVVNLKDKFVKLDHDEFFNLFCKIFIIKA